jgi:uncharacterized protein (DUF1697 family)
MARTTTSVAHAALLRGVNVGGKNKLPMKELGAMFEAAGAKDVSTFIQSGNVVFRAPASKAAGVARAVEAAIAARFGFAAPIVLRTGADLAGVVGANPFLARGEPEKALHVGFLADEPAPHAAASLDPMRSPGDAFEVRGRDLFLFLPNGVARTKLTNAWFDAKLGTTTTVRNWATVVELANRTRALGASA